MELILGVLLALAAIVFGGLGALALLGLRHVPDLPPTSDAPAGAAETVSVVVAARDDAACLEATVRQVLAQRSVELELIVVDDRSTDDTPRLCAGIAAEDPRLRVVRIDELPAGWLGKCHACHRGAEQANGDWLLFIDGDTHAGDDVVARALAEAHRTDAEHLCLVPSLANTTRGGRAIAIATCLTLLVHVPMVNADRPWASAGVGAFNLVRATAYRAVGGHAALRLEVVEDLGLGRLLRAAGYRTRVRFALRDLSVEWITTFRSFFSVIEKNAFALFGFRTARVVLATLGLSVLWLAGLCGPLFGTAAGYLAGIGFWSLTMPAALVARRYGFWPGLALLTPLMLPVVLAGLCWSTALALSRGGVRWRDTFYPLPCLRDFRAG